MVHLFKCIGIAILLSVFITRFAYAEALKDPRTRDENISNTILKITVNKRADGMYEYIYDIESPVTNKGLIASLGIDIACDLDFGEVIFSEPADPYFSGSASKDGNHVPVQPHGVYAVTAYSNISIDNRIYWVMSFKPGNIGKGIKLISPAPPGLRTYTLRPYMEPDGWDYASYDEDDPTVPWIEDFTVTGSITAPACAIDTPPTDDRFEGSGREPFGINKLLTYSNPVKDPIAVSSGNEVIIFDITYSSNILKNSFSARLNGNDISKRFNPVPNTNETIKLNGPWKDRNRLVLSVLGIVGDRVKGRSMDKRPAQSFDTPASERAVIKFDEFKSKDNDIFHIWLDQPNN